MKRKPLSPEAEAALQAVMRKACERMEQKQSEKPAGVLAQLEKEPRDE